MDRRLRFVDLGMILTLIWVFAVSSVLVLECNRLAKESVLLRNKNHVMQQLIYDLAKETRAHTHPGLWVRQPNGWTSPNSVFYADDKHQVIPAPVDPPPQVIPCRLLSMGTNDNRFWLEVSGNVSVSSGGRVR